MDHPYLVSQASGQDSRGHISPSTHQQGTMLGQGNGHRLNYEQAIKQAAINQGSPMSPDSPPNLTSEASRQVRTSEALDRTETVKVTQGSSSYPSPLLPSRFQGYIMDNSDPPPLSNSHRREVPTSTESPTGHTPSSLRDDRLLRVDGGQSHELHHILPFLQGRLPPPGYLFSKQPPSLPIHQAVLDSQFSPESPSDNGPGDGGPSLQQVSPYVPSTMPSAYSGLVFSKQVISQSSSSPRQISPASSSPDLDPKFGQPEMVAATQPNKLSQVPTYTMPSSYPYVFSKQTGAISHQHPLQDLVSHELQSDLSQQLRQEAAHIQRSQSLPGLPLQQPSIAHTHSSDYVVEASSQMNSHHQQFYPGAKLRDRQNPSEGTHSGKSNPNSSYAVSSVPSGYPAGHSLPDPKHVLNQVLNLSSETSQGGIRPDQLSHSVTSDINTLSNNQPNPTTMSYHPSLLNQASSEFLHQQRGGHTCNSPDGMITNQHDLARSLVSNANQPTDLSHVHPSPSADNDLTMENRGQSSLVLPGRVSDGSDSISRDRTSPDRAVTGHVIREALSYSDHPQADTNLRNVPQEGEKGAEKSFEEGIGTVRIRGFRGEQESIDHMDEDEESGTSETDSDEPGDVLPSASKDSKDASRDNSITPWEQIVDVAATRREEAIENGAGSTMRESGIESGTERPAGRSQENAGHGGEGVSLEHLVADGNSSVVATGRQRFVPVSQESRKGSGQASQPGKRNISLTVDERWPEIMAESGFDGDHSRFAEFLLSFYKSHKKCSEMRPGGSDDFRLGNSDAQGQIHCGCSCHGNKPDQPQETPEGVPSSDMSTDEHRPQETAPSNRRKGRQQKPRKRKMDELEETHLPYAQVPIFKTKSSDYQSNRIPEQVGMVSFSEDEEEEDEGSEPKSGMDDHVSDADFTPNGGDKSDSADDDLPLKYRRSKLRRRSAGKEPENSYEYVLQHGNPSAPLKIKLKQMAKRDADQATNAASRKPRKPAKPKKVRSPKRVTRAKAKASQKEGGSVKRGRPPSQRPKAPPTPRPPSLRRKRGENPIIKVGFSELLRQYMCKLCLCESPCIVDITLHLLDYHMDAIGAFTKCLADLEVTIGSRTASAFEFLSGRKYDDKPSKEEEPEMLKKLPPVSGILSNFLVSQEGGENRLPATSEIVMNALSQAIPPTSNAMAFLHGASPATVFNALSATGTLPYLPSLTHSALGEGGLSAALHGGNFGGSGVGRIGQDGHQTGSADVAVSLFNVAVTSQSPETDTTISVDNKKTPENFNSDALVPFLQAQAEQRAIYQNRFRKSGVDVEELSKAMEANDDVFKVIESWVKIRHQCPRCHKSIRVSKRTNMHRCRGSEDKPIYVLCDVCGNNYQKEYFSLHYNRIHCQSLIPCHICGKKFTPSSLPKHVYKHSNPPTAFKCGSCPKSFRFRMDLERHELVHRVDKPYQCPTCGRGFTQKSNMQYHMRQHTGEQPYKCDNCMKSFTHNVSLKNHLKKHHGIDLWAMGYTGGGRPKKETPGTNPPTSLPTVAPPLPTMAPPMSAMAPPIPTMASP